MRRLALLTVVLVLTASSAVLATPGAVGAAARSAPPSGCRRPPATTAAPLAAVDPYRAAVAAAGTRGLQVWLEADLLKRWWAGGPSFREGVARLAQLGADPAVIGFKVADELGYNDVVQSQPQCMRAFVTDAVRALHAASPRSQVLIDVVVPDLGCAPNLEAVAAQSARCRAANDARYPALTLRNIDKLLALRAVDVVDLSTGILDDDVYRSWGTDALQAQQAAWKEVARRHWSRDVTLNSRKALAHPGAYSGSDSTAATSASIFVDTPLHDGARAVDIWTWRQEYQGAVYRLADPGSRPNALWDALVQRHGAGALLFTHFSPSSVEESVGPDLDMISHAFGGVFVATGTG
jgi:hypothetical protein